MIIEPTFRILLVAFLALLLIGAIWGFRRQAWPK
jgi:hypothetical protein